MLVDEGAPSWAGGVVGGSAVMRGCGGAVIKSVEMGESSM